MSPKDRQIRIVVKHNMPGLTVDTSPRSQRSRDPNSPSQSNSRSGSPVQPSYSPITPTLGPSRIATPPSNPSQDAQPPRRTYTHSQPHQTAIPQPAPVSIAFDENPDALALKSAISILQMQARNAAKDIQDLQAIKEHALQDPEAFAKAIASGEMKKKRDSLFNPSRDDEDDDGDEGEQRMREDEKAWPKLPTPQNVVRCPPINWNQYAILGESLDKLHADQQMRPTEGMPQRLGADGQLNYGGDGQKRLADVGVAAPYQFGRDKIEKMSTRKGGKR